MKQTRKKEMGKKGNKGYPVFRFFAWLIGTFYREPEIIGTENLPDEPCIIVGNHCKMNGPIIAQLYLPGKVSIWCIGQMMHTKEVPDYAFHDFWAEKPFYSRWFFWLVSRVLAPLAAAALGNADTIAVYHDMRSLGTFRESVEKLQEGRHLVIFPEQDIPYNHILCDFQDKFVDTARFYYKKTKRNVCFVPLYNAPMLHKTVLGKPIYFDGSKPIAEERERICTELKESITALAVSLPRHKVVPYNNLKKKYYLWNKDEDKDS